MGLLLRQPGRLGAQLRGLLVQGRLAIGGCLLLSRQGRLLGRQFRACGRHAARLRVEVALPAGKGLFALAEIGLLAVECPFALVEAFPFAGQVLFGTGLVGLKGLALPLEGREGLFQFPLTGIQFGLDLVHGGPQAQRLALIGGQLHLLLLQPGAKPAQLDHVRIIHIRTVLNVLGIWFGHVRFPLPCHS